MSSIFGRTILLTHWNLDILILGWFDCDMTFVRKCLWAEYLSDLFNVTSPSVPLHLIFTSWWSHWLQIKLEFLSRCETMHHEVATLKIRIHQFREKMSPQVTPRAVWGNTEHINTKQDTSYCWINAFGIWQTDIFPFLSHQRYGHASQHNLIWAESHFPWKWTL